MACKWREHKRVRVLSCFDGIACGKVALQRAGIPVTQYIASEIDKYAITVSRANHPDIIQGGDVRVIRMMAEAGFFGHIDLVIAGSPCQGFSFAGKQLAFNDPRSSLFFEFVAILTALRRANPNVKFLLENVKMKKIHLDVITTFLGVQPILINSALVSAQSRQRYYWCNWSIEQPADRGILLRDIIESGDVDRDKSYCIDANYFKGGSLNNYLEKSRRQVVTGAAIRGRYEANGSTSQRLELNHSEKANALTSVQKDSLICVGIASDINDRDHHKRIYSSDGKSPTILASNGGNSEVKIALDGTYYRKLTPLECERLQTLPDYYTAHVSNTQRYRQLGNGWTVDVVAHILRSMPA